MSGAGEGKEGMVDTYGRITTFAHERPLWLAQAWHNGTADGQHRGHTYKLGTVTDSISTTFIEVPHLEHMLQEVPPGPGLVGGESDV
jgi:hypothetical protein